MFSVDEATRSNIVSSYRQAKSKSKQVTILSQLYVCSEDDIIGVLVENGVRPQELPRKRAGGGHSSRVAAPEHSSETPPKPDTKTNPDELRTKPACNASEYEATMNYIASLVNRKAELNKEISQIDAILDRIAIMCDHRPKQDMVADTEPKTTGEEITLNLCSSVSSQSTTSSAYGKAD